jgi:Fic family protein
MLAQPDAALPEIHARLVGGDRADRSYRQSHQAVHDASIGRVILRGVEPTRVPGRVAALTGWMTSTGAHEHGLVSSGVAHYETLVTQPYETANGRLARTAARLLLRARGLDPHRLAVAEPLLDEEPIAYYEQVAATIRRRDLTIWLEHWGEAVTGGLRRAARRLGLLDTEVRGHAERFLREHARFTISDYRADLDVGPEEARQDLDGLLDAGRISYVFGARGLRFTTTEEDGDGVS